MKRFQPPTFLSLLTIFIFLSPILIQAGVITPDLQKQLAAAGEKDFLNVIVKMADQVDLSQVPGKTNKLVSLREMASTSQRGVIASLNAQQDKVTKFRSFSLVSSLALTATKDVIQAVATRPEVAEVRVDGIHQLPPIQESQRVQQAEWNIDRVRAPEVWALGYDGTGVLVANIDTGVEVTHPDLSAQYQGGPNSWFDGVNGQPDPYDDYGHGTHTMGTILGRDAGGTDIGVAPGATFIAAKAFDAGGGGYDSWIIACMDWVVDPDGNPVTDDAPEVVNNSWGSDNGNDETFRPYVQNWVALDIFPAFSNGNNGPGPGTVGSPASFPESFGVGATDSSNAIASFSSRGPSPIDGSIKPDVSAPGVDIRSSFPGGGYYNWQGTSMACPHVTGTIALMLEANPGLLTIETVEDIKDVLRDNAVDLGAPGPDNDYGWGLIDAYESVTAIAHGGTLAGTVRDARNGAPLAATVTILETGDSDETNPATGWYSMMIPEGTYTVQADALSYSPDTAIVTIIEGYTTIQNFALSFARPRIVVRPTALSADVSSELTVTKRLKIINRGVSGSVLRFQIQNGLLLPAQAITWLSVDPESGDIPADEFLNVSVTFDAGDLAAGAYEADLLVSSNCRRKPLVTVHVTMNVLEPNIEVNPPACRVRVPAGETATRRLRVSNTGEGLLAFNVRTQLTSATDSVSDIKEPFTVIEGNYPNKGVEDEQPNPPQTEGSGGPDPFGYTWIDSDEPGGPVYNWIDITATGTPITGLGDDTNVGPFPIGFNFPFYGNVFDTFRFCTNGFISFTSSSTDYSNAPIPTGGEPYNLVAPFWDDLSFSTSGEAYYELIDPDTLVIEYYNVGRFNDSGAYTFEIILRSNGAITYQYQSSTSITDSCTIGIQDAVGTTGLQVVYNAPYVHDELAVLIGLEGRWLSVSHESGRVAPGRARILTLTCDATELDPGIYTGDVLVTSNDPDTPVVTVPVTMRVLPAATAPALTKVEFDLAQNYPNPCNPETWIPYKLPKSADVTLDIYSMSGQLVRTLKLGHRMAGAYLSKTRAAYWDGRNESGERVSSGVYFYRIKAGSFTATRRMLLMK